MRITNFIVDRHNLRVKLAVSVLGTISFLALIAPQLWALGDVYFYDVVGSANSVCDVGPRGAGPNGNDPASLTYDNNGCADGNHQVVLRTGESNLVPEQTTVVQANFYLPGGPGTGNPRITIRGAHTCIENPGGPNARDQVRNGYYSYNQPTPPDDVRIDTLWGLDVSNYEIGQVQSAMRSVGTGKFLHAGNSRCDNANSNSTITVNVLAGDLRAVDGVPDMYYTLFRATHINQHGPATGPSSCKKNSNTGNGGPCDGIVNSFTLRIPGANARDSITTTSQFTTKCGDASSCVTVQARDGDDNTAEANFTTFKFRFGADCSVPAGGATATVNFYDLDYGNDPTTNTIVKVTLKDNTDPANPRWLWQNAVGDFVWRANQPTYGQAYQPPAVNGNASSVDFPVERNHKYILYIINVRPVLVMQVGTPYDGVYYNNTCSNTGTNDLSCTIETTPATMSGPGTLSATVKAAPNPTGFVPVNPRTSLTVTRGATNVYSGGPTAAALNATDGTYDATFNGINLATMGLHTFDASIAYNDGTSDKTATCSYSLPMAARPYFSVIGGDIMAEGSIESWNDNAPTYAGARSQLAAIAGGDIKNFITDSDVALPSGLAFANTTAGGTKYGGQYTVTPNTSVPSPSSCTANIVGVINLTNVTSGVYCADSTVTMSGTVQPGRQITIIVTAAGAGNAVITGNIDYAYGSINDIPRLNVYTLGGDIGVTSNVTNMHGVYYAQNDFMSCTDAVGATIPDPAVYDTCNLPLDIYGQVTARGSLVLHRAAGDVSSTPAERFIYSPETWLAPGTPTDTYQSYVSLPPVL